MTRPKRSVKEYLKLMAVLSLLAFLIALAGWFIPPGSYTLTGKKTDTPPRCLRLDGYRSRSAVCP